MALPSLIRRPHRRKPAPTWAAVGGQTAAGSAAVNGFGTVNVAVQVAGPVRRCSPGRRRRRRRPDCRVARASGLISNAVTASRGQPAGAGDRDRRARGRRVMTGPGEPLKVQAGHVVVGSGRPRGGRRPARRPEVAAPWPRRPQRRGGHAWAEPWPGRRRWRPGGEQPRRRRHRSRRSPPSRGARQEPRVRRPAVRSLPVPPTVHRASELSTLSSGSWRNLASEIPACRAHFGNTCCRVRPPDGHTCCRAAPCDWMGGLRAGGTRVNCVVGDVTVHDHVRPVRRPPVCAVTNR